MTHIPPAEAVPASAASTPSFSALVRMETRLRESTEASADPAGSIALALTHALRRQHASLGVNITLLEVQCDFPPSWGLGEWSQSSAKLPPAPASLGGRGAAETLGDLVAQHEAIVREIEGLRQTNAGQTAELVLNEVCSRHREMLRVLTTWRAPVQA